MHCKDVDCAQTSTLHLHIANAPGTDEETVSQGHNATVLPKGHLKMKTGQQEKHVASKSNYLSANSRRELSSLRSLCSEN